MIAVGEFSQQKCHCREILKPLAILLAPFAPHIAEELWETLGGEGSIPVLNLVTTIAFYGAWIPFFCVAVCFINRKKSILALAPIMLSVCTLLISPGSLGRYVISLMFAIIPMAGWMLASFRQAKPKHHRNPEGATTGTPLHEADAPAGRKA